MTADTEKREKHYTAICRCRECKTELNRADNVPESKKLQIIMSAPLVAGRCPQKCRSTFSDCNMNIEIDWQEILY